MIKQSLPVLALFLGKSSAITLRPSDETNAAVASGSTSDAFANAAVDARIEADMDVASQVSEHQRVAANAHNEAWKKHFKESEFYHEYAQKNQEREDCHGKCQEYKSELNNLQFDYERLQNKFFQLKSASNNSSLA